MLYVVSEKVYSLEKRHKSDTIALCARRALAACKQGDGVLVKNLVELNTFKKLCLKKKIPVSQRKQRLKGWIMYPLFYKSQTNREQTIEAYNKAREQQRNDSKKAESNNTEV